MDTIKEIRRFRLNEIFKHSRCHTEREFAIKCEVAPSHMNAMRVGEREIGFAVARRIENAFGLEEGWMDQSVTNPIVESMFQKMFNKINKKDQDYILDLLETMYKKQS